MIPLVQSYWVVRGRFLAGEYPGSRNPLGTPGRLNALFDAGVTVFVDLTAENELDPYEPVLREEAARRGIAVTHERFPIPDYNVPESPSVMARLLTAIDEHLAAGRTVYLHCWGGIGRTGTTVGCWLERHGMDGDEALAQLAAWWKDVPKSRLHKSSPETAWQKEYVREWATLDPDIP